MNGGSAWSLDSTRNQYYLCQTGPEYPDLNLENEDVVKEMTVRVYSTLYSQLCYMLVIWFMILHMTENFLWILLR